MFYEKLNSFSEEVKKRGYSIKNHVFENEGFVVSKENHYHIKVDYQLILEIPFDYLMEDIEREFTRLEKEANEIK